MKSGLIYVCFSPDFLLEDADLWQQECWDNAIVGCTVENQQRADERLRIFSELPIRHKNIICKPMISAINLERFLPGEELVAAGGESDRHARPMDYDWVLFLREQCIRQNVSLEFHQYGTHFIKDGKQYNLQTKDLCSQARKPGINYQRNIRSYHRLRRNKDKRYLVTKPDIAYLFCCTLFGSCSVSVIFILSYWQLPFRVSLAYLAVKSRR